jgi:hypothetical protein
MRRFHRKHYKWLRHIPRKKHLKGSWLHRRLGERLFAQELWRPTKREVAGGLALGLFIGFTPTMGVQIVLSGLAAYLLRVNIPAALAGALVTNPFTAPVIYPLEYKFGLWLVGAPGPHELEGYSAALRNFVRYAKPLWIGSIVTGGVSAAIAYGLVMLLWREATHLRAVLHRKPNPATDEAAGAAGPQDSQTSQEAGSQQVQPARIRQDAAAG